MRKKVWAVLLGLGLVGGLLGPGIGFALDRSDQPIVLSLENPKSRQEFPPMIAADPEFVLVDPETCRIVPSCDVIPLSINVPDNIIYRIESTTYFIQGGTEETGGVTDIDIFYWQETRTIKVKSDGSEEIGDPTYLTIARSATAGQPEVAKMADLPSSDVRFKVSTPVADQEKGVVTTYLIFKYWITPVNWSGASPYQIEGKLSEQTITRRTRTTSTRPFVPPPPSPPITRQQAKAKTPEPSLSPVKVPGETGELQDFGLVALKGEQREPEKQNPAGLVAGALGLLVLAAGFGGFFFLRARRKAAR